MHTLFALLALVSTDSAAQPAQSTQSVIAAAPSPNVSTIGTTAKVDRFAGRPEARIAFTHEVRNFQIKRDGYDDVLYLETRRDRWFRSELNCFGIGDPRDAHGILPIGHTFGFDRFSRIALVGFGHRQTECQLDGLVELTPQEALELRLVRPRRIAAGTSTPAS